MADYKGNTCPVCKDKFKDGDDVVVCPECGTPYHRACWAKAGGCVNAAKHGTGFEWQPDITPDGLPNELVCPNCGTHNPASATVCSHCGVPLSAADAAGAEPRAEKAAGPIYSRGNGAASPAGQPTDGGTAGVGGFNYAGAENQPFKVELGPDDTISGIKAKDWASYVGRSSLYYLLQFFRLDKAKKKIGVSFSAFFLGPVYFFYRKMWKEGALFSAITLVLMIPSMLALLALSESSLVAGLNVSWVGNAMWVSSILDCVQMVLRSAFAVYWYKKDSEKRILAIYKDTPDEARRADALALRGGTSVTAVVLFVAAYLALCVALVALMGPNLSAVMQALYM